MQLDITRTIDRYLSGELSASDHEAFEERLKLNEDLRKEVELHKDIQEAAIRASVRADVQHAARRYKLNRVIKWGATGFGIIAVIITTSIWFSSTQKKREEIKQAPTIALSLVEKLNPSADFNPLAIQYFSVPKEGDVFLSDHSVMLSIPKKAFLKDGKVYSGEAIVQFQEALEANEIIKAGLNTLSGDGLLETQGMFSIHAYTPEGKQLEINPEVGVYVQVPVDEHKEGMSLYDYVELDDGTTDWQNPRTLSRIPIPVDMNLLDFYPNGYEAKLDNLKWKQQKSKRDSLYLSFENYCPESEQNEMVNNILCGTKTEQIETKQRPTRPIIKKSMLVQFPAIDAQFPGGGKAMKKFISENIVYPDEAIEKVLSGKVYVSFEVDDYGFISAERIERSAHPLLDKEALRVVRKMPRWTPAETNGQDVRTRVRIPINFYLDGPKLKPIDTGFNLMIGNTPIPVKETSSEVNLNAPIESIPQEKARTEIAVDSIALEDTPCNYPHISPSNVLAFWKPTFNNTNLATREFERRMKAIHATCNDEVLKKYTSNLKRPISEIDHDVVNMGYSDFGSFAKEQVGVVNPNNPHLDNIKTFYEKGVAALREQVKKDKNWEQQLRNDWDNHLSDLRAAHSKSTKKQQEKSKQDEVAYNQQRTVQKLGLNNQRKMNAVASYPQFQRTIGFTARRSGGYNCDRAIRRIITYQAAIRPIQSVALVQGRKIERVNTAQDVKNGTEKRETFSVTANGKSRIIAYNSLTFEVENAQKFEKIIAYAFPHKLESYQLLNGINGKFTTSLNDDIIYDICIVGISDDNYFYFQKQSLKGGKLGPIVLKQTTESKLDASILQLNTKRMSKPTSITLDLNWIKAEKKHFKEINRRKEMKVFRETLAPVIYPCYDAKPKEEIVEAMGDVNPFGI